MSARLNIGLIGSGFMGQAHADAYRRAAMFYPDQFSFISPDVFCRQTASPHPAEQTTAG